MLDSIQVLILCIASAVFIGWVMKLKKEIIALMTEASDLRGSMRERVKQEPQRTYITPGQRPWGTKG